MQLSSFAIAALGFKPIPVDGPLIAEFHLLHIFSAQGFTLGTETVAARKGRAGGTDYEIAVGSSMNAISEALLGGIFTKDEAEWAKARSAHAPYVVVHIGPTARHTATKGFVKNEDQDIISYDTFPAAREELRQLESRVLPPVEMALAVSFASADPPIRLVPVDTTTYGMTPDRITVHDLRITGHASLYTSRPIASTQLESYLTAVTNWSERLNKRVAQFFQLARRDDDELKRFLYFFLALEIEIHRVFKSVSKAAHLTNAATFDVRVGAAAQQLLEQKQDNWLNLADLFVWCVASVWKHLSVDDIHEFQRLKKVRDDIAHGNIAEPPPGSALAAERLATKLHLVPIAGA